MIRPVLVYFLVALTTCASAYAEELDDVHPWLNSKFILEVGIFYPERFARLTATGSVDVNVPPMPFPTGPPSVDFGEQFSISQSDQTFSAEAGWRMGEKWAMRMQYFDSRGANTAVLEEDIEWEDLTFLAGTNASAGTEFELTRIVWDRTFYRRPDKRFSLSAGFHWLHIRGFIEGTVLTPDGPASAYESASVDAPLPNIGFMYVHALSPRWGFRSRFDWFSADIDPYDGIFLNASVGFNYRMTNRLGIGFNYNFVQLDVGVDGDNWRGEVKTRYDGLYVYLGAVW